tara:strand:- start:137 stop:769 length:633 start_codon:yes stop_codon:yes gene_type:complete
VNKRQIVQLYQTLADITPDATTELQYTSTFELLVSVILSAQATDISVNKATEKLYRVANTPKAIHDLGLRKLKTYIKNIGLYNTKASNIIKTCRILEHNYDGKVPTSREELESLPGVGRKTANVILNTAFNHPTIAVDTHIFRVSNRTGLAKGKTVRQVEDQLLVVTPPKYLKLAHHLLILHGRYTCVARKPHCLDCAIRNLCEHNRLEK